jgi:hypothetical protein
MRPGASAGGRRKLFQRNPNSAALRCVLDCVGDEIQKNLLQLEPVDPQGLVQLIRIFCNQPDVLEISRRTDGGDDGFPELRAVNQFGLQNEFPALNAAQFQRVVHQSKQQTAGELYFFQICLLYGSVPFPQRKIREAQNGVQRSAHIMAHAGEKRGFCLVCTICLQLCRLHLGELLLIPFVGGGDVCPYHEENAFLPVQPGVIDLLAEDPAVLRTAVGGTPPSSGFKTGEDGVQCERGIEFRTFIFRDKMASHIVAAVGVRCFDPHIQMGDFL